MLITVQIAEVAIFMIFILKIIDKKWESQFFRYYPNPESLHNIRGNSEY